jgi:hypothetical protein
MSPITTPAQLTPRFGLTDVHELPTSPFDLEEFFRAIQTCYEITEKRQVLEPFLRATTFAIQAKSVAIRPRDFGTPSLYQHIVLTKLHCSVPRRLA